MSETSSKLPYVARVQKQVLFDLKSHARTDSVVAFQDTLINKLREFVSVSDSVRELEQDQLKISRDQISLLLLSQNKDIELIGIKNKEINRQKRLKILGFIAVPVVMVLTLTFLN